MRSETGQATVEWIGLVLLVCVVLAALVQVGPRVDGRSFGGFLAHRFTCAVAGGCDDGDRELARAYGARTAALVRRNAPSLVYEPGEPSLPVDWRRCRAHRCADAPADRDLDVHRSRAGQRATAFSHVLRRRGRTYIQYWLYYPDSNTAYLSPDTHVLPLLTRVLSWTDGFRGFHPDDWEGYAVRIDPDGTVWARATSHKIWRSCKRWVCENGWFHASGWTRVSRGSHAGHLPFDFHMRPLYPGHDLRERTSTAEGLRVIPLERIDRGRYRPLPHRVLQEAPLPPWLKDAYTDPESPRS